MPKIKLPNPRRRLRRLVLRIVAHYGYILIPVLEIERMEIDADQYYMAMRKRVMTKNVKSYFNGIADYSSKTAHRFRTKYMQQNAEAIRPATTNPNEA